MLNKILSVFALFCFMSTANANYTYEANQSLFNLVNEQNTTNMAAGDDQVSAAFDLGFTFTFYGRRFYMPHAWLLTAAYILRRQDLIVMIIHLIRYLRLHIHSLSLLD